MNFEVRNGSFSYARGSEKILDNVSFSVNSGEILAILGPNGAGKTTLLRCMMGFLDWTEGSSLIDGKPISEISRRQMWNRIGYVPQARGYSTSGTILELVLLGRASRIDLFKNPSESDISSAMNSLDQMGIRSLWNKNADQVSGGELQLALIAKALAGKPELLIMDEPESNLDFRNQLKVMEMIQKLASNGYSCIFNTHYPAHALRYGTHSLLLEKRGSALYGLSGTVVNENNLEKAFGVKTAIREIETDSRCFLDVLPIETAEKKRNEPTFWEREENMESRLAIVAIIIENRDAVERINSLLHEVSSYIIGRMGMPYEKKGVSIITVVMDAPQDIIAALSGKLGQLPDVSIKTTYSKV